MHTAHAPGLSLLSLLMALFKACIGCPSLVCCWFTLFCGQSIGTDELPCSSLLFAHINAKWMLVPCLACSSALRVKATCSSTLFDSERIVWCYISEVRALQKYLSHYRFYIFVIRKVLRKETWFCTFPDELLDWFMIFSLLFNELHFIISLLYFP
jgi:hypothetical protein